VISGGDGELRLADVPAVARASAPTSVPVPALEGPVFVDAPSAVLSDREMRRRERENLRVALERCGGRIYGPRGAAALLGMKPTTLASRLKRAGL
jgi:transcriptional regulator of acetoin/glycerol metabolism